MSENTAWVCTKGVTTIIINLESIQMGTELIWHPEFYIFSVFFDNFTIINQELEPNMLVSTD